MDSNLCKVIYILYCLLTGCTLSLILVTVKVSSIIFIFLVTALLFGVFALFGKYTKIDLTKITTFLFIGLLGVVVLEIINLFLLNNTLDIVLCVISIFVFLGFIAWDMQKVRRMIESGMTDDNYAIIMAFQLYLDFINVFIDLIRLFGKRD